MAPLPAFCVNLVYPAMAPLLHRRTEPTCELRKRPRKCLGSDKVDPPLSMCARVSFFLQDVNAEFRRLIIILPSFELEQKLSYSSSLKRFCHRLQNNYQNRYRVRYLYGDDHPLM